MGGWGHFGGAAKTAGVHGLGTLEGLLGSTAASAILGPITDS